MPYKSEAQRKYFNAHRKELERQGVNVAEWNESSRGKELPKKKSRLRRLAESLHRKKQAKRGR
jgi:hypothetical protein